MKLQSFIPPGTELCTREQHFSALYDFAKSLGCPVSITLRANIGAAGALWAAQCQSPCGRTSEPPVLSGLPSVNHLAGEHRSRRCSLGTHVKERPRRRIHTIRREKSAKQELPSGLLLCLWISNAACLQPRRAVIPYERWRSCQSSKATAGDPTDE